VSQDAPLAALGSVRWKEFAAIALVMLWLIEFFPALAIASRLQCVNPESSRRFVKLANFRRLPTFWARVKQTQFQPVLIGLSANWRR
jgi:hypothetical protein